ncbi:MAG: ScyD/ScyE family protein [Acidobacteria bacterium]|nr:ScyD/ScyE family protein [Acidobacteriota bacterium]
MSGLDSPRGLAFGPEGALYVTEAGRGAGVVASPTADSRCFPGPVGGLTCYGPTGAVSRLWRGEQSRVVTGLPSIAAPNGSRATGATDIVLGRGHAYLTMGLENNPLRRGEFPQIPELAGFASLVHLSASGQWRVVADVGAYEEANNPDGRLTAEGSPHLDTNPHGLVRYPGGHLITDAGANALLRVRANGDISLLAVFHSRGSSPPRPSFAPSPFPSIADAVPTSVVLGPDGAYYVSELTGVPFVDTRANVYRVVPGEEPQMFFVQDACLTGFKMILDLAFDDEGNLYVLQHATGALQQTGPGVLIRVTPDKDQSDICAQYQAGTRTTVLGGLSRPTSVVIGPDSAIYVTNNGTSMGGGQVLRSEPPAK